MYVLAKETRMLVAKKEGIMIRIWSRLFTLTYENAKVENRLDSPYTIASDFVGRYGDPVFSSTFNFRFEAIKSSSHFLIVSGMSSLTLSINLLKKPLAAPADTLDTAANMREAMLTDAMAKIPAAAPFTGVGTQAVLVTSPLEGTGKLVGDAEAPGEKEAPNA